MKKIINQLIQLQELTEALAQQNATSTNGRLTQLQQAIDSYLAELPEDLRTRFLKLQKKQHSAIVPVANGTCTGCGMTLPVSEVHSVKTMKELHICTHCARMLYTPPIELPRRVAQQTRRFGGSAQAGLSRFSAPSLMIPHSKATSRDEIIAELAERMQQEGFIDDGTALAEAALRRETIVSTALENGLAFPHVRGVEGGGLTMAMATSKKGFKFDPDSKKNTKIIIFMSIPTAASAFYLRLLSGLTQSFQKKEPRDKILEMDTQSKLFKTMLSLTKTTIK